MNSQLPAPASGVNFFCIESSSTGGTYHFFADEQPNITGDAGNHSDLNYPPMIAPTTAQAGHKYQVTVALGNPLVNQDISSVLPADVELDFTVNAGTYYEPSNTNSYNYATGQTVAPQAGDTWLFYNGYGTTVASAFAYGNSDPNWHIVAGHISGPQSHVDLPASGRRLSVRCPVDLSMLLGGPRVHG